jgi:cell division protein FtsW
VPGVARPDLGSNRWIYFPVIGKFQPSELAKVVGVVAMAGWFARWQTETHTFWRGFVLPGMIIGLPVGLIAIETDVGSALALSVTAAAIFFCVGTRLYYLLPTSLVGMAGAAWFVHSNENRWSRIEAWMDLEAHSQGKGMQQWRALLACGTGGPWGVGLGNGSEKFGTLTYAHIDFIFPVVGEELGLPFTLGAVLCYVIIAVSGLSIASQATNMFDRVLALGLTSVIVVPAMVNIAVVTAVFPNDGLPLPFVSYGGTSLLISMGAVGLLCGIHRRSRVTDERPLPLVGMKSYAVKL